MSYRLEFGYASGMSDADYHLLGLRFEGESFNIDTADSWALAVDGTSFTNPFMKRGWLTALWRTAGGTVYTTDAFGKVFHFEAPERERPNLRTVPLEGTLTGIWGLNDAELFVWGRSRGQPIMYRGARDTWARIPSPGPVLAMHGVSPELIFAVGETGLIARWNGSAWQPMASPSSSVLSSVFAVSEQEVYACGTGRELLRGSAYGWTKVLEHNAPLRAIAKWQDRIWVAAGEPDGLSVLENDKLVSLKPKILATRFDARGDLLMSCLQKTAFTKNGKDFWSVPIEPFRKMVEPVAPSWL